MAIGLSLHKINSITVKFGIQIFGKAIRFFESLVKSLLGNLHLLPTIVLLALRQIKKLAGSKPSF